MSTTFPTAGKAVVKEVRRRLHRYWSLIREDDFSIGQPWTRWEEHPMRTMKNQDLSEGNPSIKFVVDLIDDKVIHSTMTLRELEMMRRRHWPLKAKMLETLAERAKAKKSRRTMKRWARELEEK